MVWGGRREEGSRWGTHVYLWQIHFDIWQNQYNIVKFKNKIKLEKKKKRDIRKHEEKGTEHCSKNQGWDINTVWVLCFLAAKAKNKQKQKTIGYVTFTSKKNMLNGLPYWGHIRDLEIQGPPTNPCPPSQRNIKEKSTTKFSQSDYFIQKILFIEVYLIYNVPISAV